MTIATTNPFDDDKLHEECGVFGIFGSPDAAALTALGQRGLTRVLVEGGGSVAAGLLRLGLVDRLAWFRAPRVIGGDGLPAVAGFGLVDLAEAPTFALTDLTRIGNDVLETYGRRD